MEQLQTGKEPITPFKCSYTPQIPELLMKLEISLAISTYQAGKLVLISARDEASLSMLPRSFESPMGIDIKGDKMLIACKDELIVLENSKELANSYPKKPNTYDSLFMPRITYYTGRVDMHDVAFGNEGIWGINTSFSCLCLINGDHNFIPKWKPKFISEFVSEDRCHLNGLVLQDGIPRYVTALGVGNTFQSWRESIVDGGVLIDIKTDEIIFEKLPMPHSPISYKGNLYVLLSAKGQLATLDIKTQKVEIIKELEGFCRGMDIIDDYAFIGMSKLRKNSSTFSKLPFSESAIDSGIKIIHLPTKAFVGELKYEATVDEIYGLKILKNSLRPNVLSTINNFHKRALSIPNQTYWAKDKEEDL